MVKLDKSIRYTTSITTSQPTSVLNNFSFAYVDFFLTLPRYTRFFTHSGFSLFIVVLHRAYYDNQWIPAMRVRIMQCPKNSTENRIERLCDAVSVCVCCVYTRYNVFLCLLLLSHFIHTNGYLVLPYSCKQECHEKCHLGPSFNLHLGSKYHSTHHLF